MSEHLTLPDSLSLSPLSISPVMVGKRGCLSQEGYREHYTMADELAAMISGAIKSARQRA